MLLNLLLGSQIPHPEGIETGVVEFEQSEGGGIIRAPRHQGLGSLLAGKGALDEGKEVVVLRCF